MPQLTLLAAFAISLLNIAKVSFLGLDLSGINIQGANLIAANMTYTNLSDANCQRVTFVGAQLDHSDLSGCQKYLAFFEAIDAIDPNGQYVVGVRNNGVGCDSYIDIYQAISYRYISTLKGHTDHITCCAFSPDSRQLVSVSTDGTIRIWMVETGACLKIYGGDHYSRQANILTDCFKKVYYPSSRYLATLNAGILRFWLVETGESISHGVIYRIADIDFSPDGNYFVIACSDNVVRRFSLQMKRSLKLRHRNNYIGHSDAVNCVRHSPDGKQIASGSRDETVCLWNTSSGKCLIIFRGHGRCISSISYSLDGTRIASASDDMLVYDMDVHKPDEINGECLLTHEVNFDRNNIGIQMIVNYSPDGTFLRAKSVFGELREWPVGGAYEHTLPQPIYQPGDVSIEDWITAQGLSLSDWQRHAAFYRSSQDSTNIMEKITSSFSSIWGTIASYINPRADAAQIATTTTVATVTSATVQSTIQVPTSTTTLLTTAGHVSQANQVDEQKEADVVSRLRFKE